MSTRKKRPRLRFLLVCHPFNVVNKGETTWIHRKLPWKLVSVRVLKIGPYAFAETVTKCLVCRCWYTVYILSDVLLRHD